MPEIGEVARIVHFIRKHLVGKTLAIVKAQHDENVYGKVGTSAAEFEKNMTGKMILDAKQQGKYFWLIMSTPPHPLLHFGMSGWFEIRSASTSYRKSPKPQDSTWPPKYWKFTLETADEPKCEAAFVDSRRFGRIRLLDCEADKVRHVSPLKENGPDPVIDRDVVTMEWLAGKLRSRKVPVKAFLLDQANISGIGNWVGDEILYHSAIHPEQFTHHLLPNQISRLHASLLEITTLAVATLADSTQFPESWLFDYRWTKGKKGALHEMPNGAKISFVTVGGRTSAVVESVQIKTKGVKEEEASSDVDSGGKDEVAEPGTAKTKRSGKKAVQSKKPRKSEGPVGSDLDDGTEDLATETAPRQKAKNSSTAKPIPSGSKSRKKANHPPPSPLAPSPPASTNRPAKRHSNTSPQAPSRKRQRKTPISASPPPRLTAENPSPSKPARKRKPLAANAQAEETQHQGRRRSARVSAQGGSTV